MDAGQLLYDLCVGLGFCLPPEEQDRIIRFPPCTVEAFTDEVISSEGLDPVTIPTTLRTAVLSMVAGHFEAAERGVAQAEERLGVLIPQPVRVLYAASNGRPSQTGQWDVVWPMASVIEWNESAWRGGTLPRHLLAFGDDGTGSPFCVSLTDKADEVLRWNWTDRAVEVVEGTVEEFCRAWL